MKLGLCAAVAVAQLGVAAADPVKGLQDPANPIKPEPAPAPSPPDPVVTSSANHGLEGTSRHQGLNLTLALGGGLTVGVGIDSSIGRGPSGSARLSHMASERWAFVFEIANTTLLHKGGTDGKTRTDVGNNVLFGAQLYANRVLWLRTGVGFGSFQIDDGTDMGTRLRGPVGVVGGGFDLVRFRRIAIGLETMGLGMINRDGLLTSMSFMLDLSIE